MENREHAMKWWNNLSSLRKAQITETNARLIGDSWRRWETLTGREIENIYLNGYIFTPLDFGKISVDHLSKIQ